MKKISTAIFALAIISLIFVVEHILSNKYYQIGLKCFENGDFQCSAHHMQKLLYYDKNNKDYRYYYVKSLSNIKPNYNSERILYNIANSDTNDSAKAAAQNTIAKWKKEILSPYRNNYIEQVPADYQIIRWSKDSFPLPVYFKNFDNVPEYYKTAIISALNKWSNSIDFIDFRITENKPELKLLIEIKEQSTSQNDNPKDIYVVGTTSPIIENGKLAKMKIIIYDKNIHDQYFSKKEIYATMIHEIGHALGIMGHSYNDDDAMFHQQRGRDHYTEYRGESQALTDSDINTIKLLYNLKPDITDENEDNNNLIYTQMILGEKNDIIARKIREGEQYIKNAPEIVSGYINLAGTYCGAGEYGKAEDLLLKGLKYTKDNNEKYVIFYNLAYVYYMQKNYDEALNYANMARKINDSEEVSTMIENIKIQTK